MKSMKFCVLGGGISGLSSAFFLQKYLPTCQIILYESTHRFGGWMKSEKRGGTNFEWGPNSLRGGSVGSLTWKMIEDLGLKEQVLEASNSGGKRYILRDGQIVQIGLKDLCFKHPSIFKEPFQPKGLPDEPLLNFFQRRLGTEVTAEYLDAFINGVYAGGADHLSSACVAPFNKLKRMEQQYGSIAWGVFNQWLKAEKEEPFLGPKSPYSFKDGMDTLSRELQEYISSPQRLNPVECHTRFEIDENSLNLYPDRVEWKYQSLERSFDGLISAIPATKLGKLCSNPELDILLNQQRLAASVWIVGISFPHTETTRKLEGFGHLIPGKEKQYALGAIWNSSLWNSEKAHFTIMLGGRRSEELKRMSLDQIMRRAEDVLKNQLNIQMPSDGVDIGIEFAENCIRHYELGHLKRIDRLRNLIGPRSVLVGSSYDGVSIHDCIKSADAQVKALLKRPAFKDHF